MIAKKFDEIGKADIEQLVSNSVVENKSLEYKQELPGGNDEQRKEWLGDVSSFANAAGGDILYGVAEKRDPDGKATGIPERADGVALPNGNTDTEIRKLEAVIRDSVEPRMAVQIKAIDGFAVGPVILIRIPKSYAAPHMVTFKKHSRFYSRNSAGKYPLDVSEIRSAFAMSESIPERIRRFRDERVEKILSGETPVPIAGHKIAVHFFPMSIVDSATPLGVDVARNIPPIDWVSSSMHTAPMYNFDGAFVFAGKYQPLQAGSYVQIFRTGAIEAVVSTLFGSPSQGLTFLPSDSFEKEILSATPRFFEAMTSMGVTPPIAVLLTLIDVKGVRLGVRNAHNGPNQPLSRDLLAFPELIVNDLAIDPATLWKPIFDFVWQSFGWDCSKSYDATGKWAPK